MTRKMFLCQVTDLVKELSFRRYFNPAVDSEVSSLDLINTNDS